MTREQCEKCKHFAVLKKGEWRYYCCMLYAMHVRSVDWCESYKADDRKEEV